MAKGELSGIKVLVTRPAEQAGPLCELIEKAGGEAFRFPLLAIEAVTATPELQEQLAQLDHYDLAIFISPNAVRYAIEAAAPFGGIPYTLSLAAVGQGSRRELEKQLGRPVDIAPEERYDSETLLAHPDLQEVSGQRILIFRGNGGRELLAETLRQRGATVDYAEVYRRLTPAPASAETIAAWQRDGVNAVTATSNESLQNLYEMVTGPARDWLLGTQLLVVSARAAALAQELGFRHPALIADNASDEAIVATLTGWAREQTESELPERPNEMSETENQPIPSEQQPEHHEDELSGEAEQEHATGKTPRRSSPVGIIALLVALLACTAAVLLWNNLRELRSSSEASNAQLQDTLKALQSQEQQQRSSLTAETAERDQKLAARQESLQQQMDALRDQLGHDRIEWQVAETDFLLRYAGRHLLLERDVRGALVALHGADELLAEAGDPLYLPAREKLNEEIHALEAVPAVDVDGIALQLGAISRETDKLPLATARRSIAKYQSKNEEPASGNAPWYSRLFNAMLHDIKGLVTVHRLNQNIQPLLPPDERYFLTQNLRLRLETARLSLLRGDNASYQDNLQVANQWLNDYFDTDDAAVKSNLATLQKLAAINIAPAMPEIGEALRTLEKIRAKSGNKPAAGSANP